MASQQIIDDVLGALVRRCPNGLGRKYYSLDEVAGLFPDVEREVLEEALYDAEAEILVEKRQVLSGPLSVRLTLNCFEKFDPTVMGWTPRTDALKLAELMLKHNVERTADLEELSGMERRRFNPAFDWLLSYPLSTQDGFVSKELSSEFRASSVILAPEVKAALRRFISSETSTGTLARPSPLGALGELALGELPGVAYQGDLKSSGAEAKAAIGVIEDRIAQSPREIEEMVGGLSALIEQEIDRLSAATPNAPDDLERHNQYRDFLMQVQRQLHSLRDAIVAALAAPDTIARKHHFEAAAQVVQRLGKEFKKWLDDNASNTVGYAANVGLLGAGCAVLGLCGVSPNVSFWPLVALLGGEKLAKIIAKARGSKSR